MALQRMLVLIVAVMLTLPVYVSPAMAVDEDPAAIADGLQFRHNFGLSTDPEMVEQTTADPDNAPDQYPVALTSSERAEMDRRIAMEDEMGALELYAEGQRSFAGHWIDQPAGGIITVAFAGDADIHRAALEVLTPRGAQLSVIDVKYTLAELETLDRRIRQEVDALNAEGGAIGHWYVDLPRNGITIGVRDPAANSEADLRTRYGDAIAIEPSNPGTTACTSRSNCIGPPLRAGISGGPLNTLWVNQCTVAFMVHKGTLEQWLTAGHCAKTLNVAWYHNGNGAWPIGAIKQTCWPSCTYSDSARAGDVNATYASYKVYLHGNASGVSVSSSQALNADDIGDYTCLNARMATSWRCGSIQSIGTVCYQGNPCTLWFDEQRFANYASQYGDSGGAVHSAIISYGVRAYGVHSGCTNLVSGVCQGNGIYGHIARINQELGVTVCTVSAPCP
jgi:hypothetical protein